MGKFFFFIILLNCHWSELPNVSKPEHDRLADRGLHDAYESLPTPRNLISTDLWAPTLVNNHASTFVHPKSLLAAGNTSTAGAIYSNGIAYSTAPNPITWTAATATAYQNNSVFAPLTTSDPTWFDGSTFATNEGYHDADALQNASYCHNWEAARAAGHSDNHAFAPLTSSNSWRLTDSAFATGATYSDVAAGPNTLIPYTWGPAATTAYSSNYTSAPFIASEPLHLNEHTFATGAAYNGGNADSGVPWAPVATTQFTDHFNDSGFQYADPTLQMMSPYTTDVNGRSNAYQDRITAPSFNTPLELTGNLQGTPHATHDSGLDLAPQRPTCTNCNKSFTRKADLDRHAKKHQPNAKAFRCGVVGCTFDNYRKDKVSVHIRRRHGGVGAVLPLA